MNRSRHISLREKLASALLMLARIPYDEAKKMTAADIIGRFDFHHGIPFSEGGENVFWNLTPLWREQHREQTAHVDVPRIAKNKRVAAKHLAHLERLKGK